MHHDFATTTPPPDEDEHVILVAFHVMGGTRYRAQDRLMNALPEPEPGRIEGWWVAEDDRHDGSDNDSAVFVTPGHQAPASVVLHAAGLTPSINVIIADGEGMYGVSEDEVDDAIQKAKESLLDWIAGVEK